METIIAVGVFSTFEEARKILDAYRNQNPPHLN